MAIQWDFIVEGSTLKKVATAESGDYGTTRGGTFKAPTFDLVNKKISFFNYGTYMFALEFQNFNEIGGVAPTSIEDAYDKLVTLTINFNGGGATPQAPINENYIDVLSSEDVGSTITGSYVFDDKLAIATLNSITIYNDENDLTDKDVIDISSESLTNGITTMCYDVDRTTLLAIIPNTSSILTIDLTDLPNYDVIDYSSDISAVLFSSYGFIGIVSSILLIATNDEFDTPISVTLDPTSNYDYASSSLLTFGNGGGCYGGVDIGGGLIQLWNNGLDASTCQIDSSLAITKEAKLNLNYPSPKGVFYTISGSSYVLIASENDSYNVNTNLKGRTIKVDDNYDTEPYNFIKRIDVSASKDFFINGNTIYNLCVTDGKIETFNKLVLYAVTEQTTFQSFVKTIWINRDLTLISIGQFGSAIYAMTLNSLEIIEFQTAVNPLITNEDAIALLPLPKQAIYYYTSYDDLQPQAFVGLIEKYNNTNTNFVFDTSAGTGDFFILGFNPEIHTLNFNGINLSNNLGVINNRSGDSEFRTYDNVGLASSVILTNGGHFTITEIKFPVS
jgi:hypothetical protein